MNPADLRSDPLLVDTNVCSRLAENDPAYEPFRPFTIGRFLFLSFVTVGEILAGARHANFGHRRTESIERVLGAYGVLSGDGRVARAYADLWARTRRAGTPVGDNDLWIAATALAQDPPLPVLTNDGDFRKIAAISALEVVAPG